MENYTKITQIRLVGIQYSESNGNYCSLVLGDVDGEGKMTVVIGVAEANAIIAGVKDTPSLRPYVHDTMLELVKSLGYALRRVVIYEEKDGVFCSYLYFGRVGAEREDPQTPFGTLFSELDMEEYLKLDSRTSDAIALAVRCNCPIFVSDPVWRRFCNEFKSYDFEKCNMKDFSAMQNFEGVPQEWLQRYLQDALEREDYETAIKIREKLKRMQ